MHFREADPTFLIFRGSSLASQGHIRHPSEQQHIWRIQRKPGFGVERECGRFEWCVLRSGLLLLGRELTDFVLSFFFNLNLLACSARSVRSDSRRSDQCRLLLLPTPRTSPPRPQPPHPKPPRFSRHHPNRIHPASVRRLPSHGTSAGDRTTDARDWTWR